MLGLFIATLILYAVHICIISTRSLHMLQQIDITEDIVISNGY